MSTTDVHDDGRKLGTRAAFGAAIVLALVVIGSIPAQAAVTPGAGPVGGGNAVQVDVPDGGFAKLFGGPLSNQAYGVTLSGTLYAWGQDNFGQLGDGAPTSYRWSQTPVVATGALAGKTILQVQGGTGSTVALASDGTLFTWGDNTNGQLAQPSSTSASSIPVAVPLTGVLAGKTIVQIASGASNAYALASDGTLFSWGYCASGGLGVTCTPGVNAYAPVQVVIPGQTIVQVSAMRFGAVALTASGALYAWGQGGNGQLGNGTTPSMSMTPVAVTMTGGLAGKTIQRVVAMGDSVMALSTDGSLVVWGSGASGALGRGSTTNSSVPIAMTGFGGKSIASMAGMQAGAIALATDGTEFAWGANGYGTIGNGTTTNALVPTSASTGGALAGKTITQVIGTTATSLAILSDGSVAAWGQAGHGNLGNGVITNASALSPVAATMPTVGMTVDGTAVTTTRASGGRFGFTAPAHAAGSVDVVVSVGGNASYPLTTTTLAGGYTYGIVPTLLSGLADATAGAAYSQPVASGNPAGTTYIVTAGALPAGLSLSTATGALSGTPTTAGTSSFTITATAAGVSALQAFTLTTAAAPPSPVPSPSVTPTPTPTPTLTPTQTVSPAPTPTPTPTPTLSTPPTSAPQAAPAPSATPTPVLTPTPSPIPVPTPTGVDPVTTTLDIGAAVGDAAEGAPITVSRSGLLPGSAWVMTMHSTPVVLARGVVPASGEIDESMRLPATVPAGSHTLIFTATSVADGPVVTRTWFAVTTAKTFAGISKVGPVQIPGPRSPGAAAPGDALAITGFAALAWVGGASVLLILGLGLVLLSRRRRPGTDAS